MQTWTHRNSGPGSDYITVAVVPESKASLTGYNQVLLYDVFMKVYTKAFWLALGFQLVFEQLLKDNFDGLMPPLFLWEISSIIQNLNDCSWGSIHDRTLINVSNDQE